MSKRHSESQAPWIRRCIHCAGDTPRQRSPQTSVDCLRSMMLSTSSTRSSTTSTSTIDSSMKCHSRGISMSSIPGIRLRRPAKTVFGLCISCWSWLLAMLFFFVPGIRETLRGQNSFCVPCLSCQTIQTFGLMVCWLWKYLLWLDCTCIPSTIGSRPTYT